MAADLIHLQHDRFSLSLAPRIGGSIAAFRRHMESGDELDLLRPMSPAALATGDVLGAGCFPLTPFSNRLRAGRCQFRGRDIILPLNSDGPHVEHGHGWQRPWEVADHAEDRATLVYRHQPDAWFFAYEMRQHFRLTPDGLSVTIEASNLGREAMPYGFGLHPYFPRTPACTLQAKVDGFWEVDHEVMPTRLVPVPARADLNRGIRVDDSEMDNAFTGWGGKAVITWPERSLRLNLAGSGPLRFLVVYIPTGEDHFCVEPVSNSTDAFNLVHERDDTGMMILAPGERVTAEVHFTVDLI
jgi:aldose 1-epimerase